jgi:CHAT domain-containing protein/tetratricopeptide (TPR) repeat protein
MRVLWGPAALILVTAVGGTAQSQRDPDVLLQEAERLAWLKAWTRAAPLYAEAEQLFTARGDPRNALFARINHLRGQLPTLPIADVSQQLAAFLDDPVVQSDARLRLRCLVIKGETDQDLDPTLAEASWREALAVAESLGDQGWVNRARGELGLVAFLQGNVNASIVALGQALKVAQTTGDTASVVRWTTLFGHGFVQLDRPAEALEFYDRALRVAATVPELQFPVMTHVGKGDALIRMGRIDEAAQVINAALNAASKNNAAGYQAQLQLQLAAVAQARKDARAALDATTQAATFAREAGAGRLVAEVTLRRAEVQRALGDTTGADRSLQEGTAAARSMHERFLLPQLLAARADLHISRKQYDSAAALLEEANDLLDGWFTHASSPWVKSRLVSGMNSVFMARIRLEGERRGSPAAFLAVVEQARGRALLELLQAQPMSEISRSAAVSSGERRIAALQLQLFDAANQRERQRVLDEIFAAELQLAPAATELFSQTRRAGPRSPVSLADLQQSLRDDEVFLEFVLAEPASYCLIVSRRAARVQRLPAKSQLEPEVQSLIARIRNGDAAIGEARTLARSLLGSVKEVGGAARLVISPDGVLHQVPFELLEVSGGRRLLDSHVVSYTPSGSVLAVLRERGGRPTTRSALAVSATTDAGGVPAPGGAPVERSVYDVQLAALRPLPSATDEAKSVVSIVGPENGTVLIGDAATENALKRHPLHNYRVLHFAVHGLPSTTFPTRAALLMRPGGGEDGLLQASEILGLRVRAELVTLSACDTGSGSEHGQDGVSSLVRPFFAAGARSVVANLWAADDSFSLTLMREFYRRLAAGDDVGQALRVAKLGMIERFGPQATARLWSGVVVYGDATASIAVTASTSR